MIYTREEVLITVQDDHTQLTNSLLRYIPASWTSGEAKQRRGTFYTLMAAIGLMLAFVKGNIDELKRQFRIATATGNTLDVMAVDYFSLIKNLRLPRLAGETDNQFRERIRAELLQLRTTKRGIRRVVNRVTGAQPVVLENLNVNTFSAWTGPATGGLNGIAIAPLVSSGFPANTNFMSYFGGLGSRYPDQFQAKGNPPTLPAYASEINNLAVSLTVFTNLKCWLKPETLDAAGNVGGSKISFWPNAAPGISGYDAIALNDAQRPTYRLAINGSINCARFDGVDDQLVINTDSGPAARYTIFIVYMPFTTLVATAQRNILVGDNNFSLGYTYDNGYQVDNNNGVSIITNGMKIVKSFPVMQTFTSLGAIPSTSPYSCQARLNGESMGCNAGVQRLSGVKIGGGASFPSDANIFEYIYYDRLLTPDEILAVESYLNLKYILGQLPKYAPQPGIGALGGSQYGAAYNFFVFALQNPNAASSAAILSVIRRSKPIGTVENLFVSK